MQSDRSDTEHHTDSNRADARHEAGHAVAAAHFGYTIFDIDIIPKIVPNSGGQLGKAGIGLSLPSAESLFGRGEESVNYILIILFSGFQAEKKENPKAVLETHHSHSDGARANRYAYAAIIKPVVENGKLVMKAADIDRNLPRIKALLKTAEEQSSELVTNHEAAIDALTDLLVDRGSLTGAEVVACLTEVD